jgi:hexosaminidase
MSIVFTTSDNFPYPLRSVSATDGHDPGHPGRIWTNQSSSSHQAVSITLPAILRIETDVLNGTRVWVNDKFTGRFEVFVYGGRNTLFSWSQMALVAPLQRVEGGVDGIVLEDGVGKGARGRNSSVGVPVSNGSVVRLGSRTECLAVVVGMMVLLFSS